MKTRKFWLQRMSIVTSLGLALFHSATSAGLMVFYNVPNAHSDWEHTRFPTASAAAADAFARTAFPNQKFEGVRQLHMGWPYYDALYDIMISFPKEGSSPRPMGANARAYYYCQEGGPYAYDPQLLPGGGCSTPASPPPPWASTMPGSYSPPPKPAFTVDGLLAAGCPTKGGSRGDEYSFSTIDDSGNDDNAIRGNPVNAAWGNKCQSENFDLGQHSPIRWFYNSYGNPVSNSGAHWVNNLEIRVSRSDTTTAKLLRPDGKVVVYSKNNGQWGTIAKWRDQFSEQLNPDGSTAGYTITHPEGTIESFNANGELIKIAKPNGRFLEITRFDLVYMIQDESLKYTFVFLDQSRRITSAWQLFGNRVSFEYDSAGNLSKAIPETGRVRTYLYEDARYPHALTGIIDENGNRYATWTYDDQGRAISSEHAGGVNKTTFAYGGDGTTKVTYANGAVEKLTFISNFGVPYLNTAQAPCIGTCTGATRTFGVDDYGNRTSESDAKGVTTIRAFNSRGLEISRTEAKGTAQERTITTDWHATWALPVKITEPGRVTELTYDANSNLLTKKITAGTAVRTWSWTYGNYGYPATATDPNGNVTQYLYDYGELKKITNPAGKEWFYTYDSTGQLYRIQDPNGLDTYFSYTPRGWLKSRTVGVETTTYDYDGVGQLTKVTFPDGHFVSYTYDAAHRLTDVADTLGNKIHYTLDLVGNKLKEEIYDPSGALAAAMQAVDQSRQSPLPNPADAA